MKLGFFTDTHSRFETPEERTDNFFKSLMVKLSEVGQIFADEEVDAVLFGGDLYDSDNVAKSVITAMQTELRTWHQSIYGVVGSHDYIGYQMKSLKSTALGITESAGIIQLIGGAGHDAYIKLPDSNIVVVGTPHIRTFTDSLDNMYTPLYEKDTFQIQVVHGDLNDKSVPWPHILVQDGLTDSHLVLSGHYHPGWKEMIVKKAKTSENKVKYINPGAIARMKNTGVQRRPRVCILTIEGMLCQHKFIELKSAIEHPFLPKEKKEEEMPMLDVQKFLELIGRNEVTAVDIKAQLPEVAKEYGFSEEVVKVAFELIDEEEDES